MSERTSMPERSNAHDTIRAVQNDGFIVRLYETSEGLDLTFSLGGIDDETTFDGGKLRDLVDRFQCEPEFASDAKALLFMEGPVLVDQDQAPPSVEEMMEKAIQAKIEAATARGVDLIAMVTGSAEEKAAVYSKIGFTVEDEKFMTEMEIRRAVRVEIGRRVVDTLNSNGVRIASTDLAACVTAFFEQEGYGEAEAA